MPKNKRPNRKPANKKTGKQIVTNRISTGPEEGSGEELSAGNEKPAAKTYGSPNSASSNISPAMNRRSARSR